MISSQSLARPGRCWYCGKNTLRVGDPPEHTILAAIGGTLTTDRVCKSCNHNASVIDQRLAEDYFVALERNRHEIRDRRGKLPPRVRQKVVGRDDGKRYRINTRRGDFVLEPLPHVIKNDDGSFIAAGATVEEAHRAAERILRNLQSQGLRIGEIRREQLPPTDVVVSLKIRPTDYVRAAAKIGLSALSLVWDDAWLDSSDAKRLQRWVRDKVPTNDQGNALGGRLGHEPDFLARICSPPEHLIVLWPHGDEVTVMIILFGTMVLPLRVATAGHPQPRRVWRMNPLTRSLEELTLDQLMIEAVMRANGGDMPQFEFE